MGNSSPDLLVRIRHLRELVRNVDELEPAEAQAVHELMEMMRSVLGEPPIPQVAAAQVSRQSPTPGGNSGAAAQRLDWRPQRPTIPAWVGGNGGIQPTPSGGVLGMESAGYRCPHCGGRLEEQQHAKRGPLR